MNAVEGSPLWAAVAQAGTSPADVSRVAPDGPAPATPDPCPIPSALAATPAPPPDAPAGGLASLLGQARAAQAQLAIQPLPISNHRNRLITQLFGG